MQNGNQGIRWSTVTMVIICIVVTVSMFAGSWYFWGADGAKTALIIIGGALLWLMNRAMQLDTVRTVSGIYRDAVGLLVDFQAADDRGEVARAAVNLIRTGNQLDGRVMTLAGNLAKQDTNQLSLRSSVHPRITNRLCIHRYLRRRRYYLFSSDGSTW